MKNKTIRALLVEDNPGDARLLREMLPDVSSHSFDLTHVARLSEALRELEETGFDVILLDLVLPDAQGFEAFLRMQSHARAIPVIVLTGLADQDLAVRAVRHGAQDFLVKGQFDGDLLARAVQYAIERKRIMDELAAANVLLQEEIVERRRVEETLRRRNRELILLNRVISATASSQEVESILEVVCRELVQALGASQAAAALLDSARTEMRVIAEYRGDGNRQPTLGMTIPIQGNPAAAYLLEQKSPLTVADARSDPKLAPVHGLVLSTNVVALLVLPLRIDGDVEGCLGLAYNQAHDFVAEEIDLAQRVAEQASVALAHARLTETQRRLSAAVEQSAGSVVITDTDSTILYVNPAFERISGYSRQEVVGQTTALFKSGKHAPSFYDDLWETLRAGRVWQGRLVNRKKDGTLYLEDTTIAPVRNAADQIVSYVSTMRDVTREVQLEEQFRQAQKLEALGRLARGIAHDFNNLLTVIHMNAGLLEYKLSATNPLQAHVHGILETSQRASDLVRQLLSFGSQQVVASQILDLNQIVGGMSRMLDRLIGSDIQLVTSLAEETLSVRADPSQIEQVILNLVVNARDAMPDGGSVCIETSLITLDATYVAGHVDAQVGEHVLLTISDMGVGMTDEVQAHVFEPFFTTKEKGKGTGLGLSTVYGIVKQSGGHIRVESQVGQGTAFFVCLPRVASAEAEGSTQDETAER